MCGVMLAAGLAFCQTSFKGTPEKFGESIDYSRRLTSEALLGEVWMLETVCARATVPWTVWGDTLDPTNMTVLGMAPADRVFSSRRVTRLPLYFGDLRDVALRDEAYSDEYVLGVGVAADMELAYDQDFNEMSYYIGNWEGVGPWEDTALAAAYAEGKFNTEGTHYYEGVYRNHMCEMWGHEIADPELEDKGKTIDALITDDVFGARCGWDLDALDETSLRFSALPVGAANRVNTAFSGSVCDVDMDMKIYPSTMWVNWQTERDYSFTVTNTNTIVWNDDESRYELGSAITAANSTYGVKESGKTTKLGESQEGTRASGFRLTSTEVEYRGGSGQTQGRLTYDVDVMIEEALHLMTNGTYTASVESWSVSPEDGQIYIEIPIPYNEDIPALYVDHNYDLDFMTSNKEYKVFVTAVAAATLWEKELPTITELAPWCVPCEFGMQYVGSAYISAPIGYAIEWKKDGVAGQDFSSLEDMSLGDNPNAKFLAAIKNASYLSGKEYLSRVATMYKSADSAMRSDLREKAGAASLSDVKEKLEADVTPFDMTAVASNIVNVTYSPAQAVAFEWKDGYIYNPRYADGSKIEGTHKEWQLVTNEVWVVTGTNVLVDVDMGVIPCYGTINMADGAYDLYDDTGTHTTGTGTRTWDSANQCWKVSLTYGSTAIDAEWGEGWDWAYLFVGSGEPIATTYTKSEVREKKEIIEYQWVEVDGAELSAYPALNWVVTIEVDAPESGLTLDDKMKPCAGEVACDGALLQIEWKWPLMLDTSAP